MPLSLTGRASRVIPVTQKGCEKHHGACSEHRDQHLLLAPPQHSIPGTAVFNARAQSCTGDEIHSIAWLQHPLLI